MTTSTTDHLATPPSATAADLTASSPLILAADREMVQGGDLESLLRVLVRFRHHTRGQVLEAAHECRAVVEPEHARLHWHQVARSLELAATTGLFPH